MLREQTQILVMFYFSDSSVTNVRVLSSEHGSTAMNVQTSIYVLVVIHLASSHRGKLIRHFLTYYVIYQSRADNHVYRLK